MQEKARRVNRSKFTASRLLLALVILVVLWLLVVPVVMLIASSLRTGPPSLPGPWTLRNFAVAFSSEFFFRSLLNTFIVSSGATAAALALAIGFAWLIERTDMPFRGAAWVAVYTTPSNSGRSLRASLDVVAAAQNRPN